MRRGLFIIALFVFSIFSASAAVVDINTLPNHDIWITAKHPVDYSTTIMPPMKFSSNSNGSLIITYEIYESFSLFISVKNGNQYVVTSREETVYHRDDYVTLDLFPEGYTAPVRSPAMQLVEVEENETIVVEENPTEETENITNETIEKTFSFSMPQLSFNINYVYYAVGLLFLIFMSFLIFRGKKVQAKIECVNKKIIKHEKRIEKLRSKKKELLLKAKEEMIKREESLIKIRGGSVPEKKEEKSMVEKLNESLNKDKNNSN